MPALNFEDCIHLELNETTRMIATEYGKLPNLFETDPDHDILFTMNGTTSGVCVPNLDWIAADRKGLTFNDATSAAFAMNIDWQKVDVGLFYSITLLSLTALSSGDDLFLAEGFGW